MAQEEDGVLGGKVAPVELRWGTLARVNRRGRAAERIANAIWIPTVQNGRFSIEERRKPRTTLLLIMVERDRARDLRSGGSERRPEGAVALPVNPGLQPLESSPKGCKAGLANRGDVPTV